MALKSGRVGIHPSQVDPITGMLIGGTGGASIDDTSVSTETTWSSNKINSELSGKQDELTAGSNITIQDNVISSTASGGLLPELQITAITGSTVTATKGTTVITATEISSGLFTCEVPEFGTYTVSDGTDSTTVTVDTVKIYEVEIIPTPSVISVTLTLYSATEDQVTVVDEDGTHLEQFASGQSSKSITVKVLAEGSNVTFTSSIAKNPSDLSEYYTKTVSISSGTTEVYCMPDNALYWYGYGSNNFTFPRVVSTGISNILNNAQSGATSQLTNNTNDIQLVANSNSSKAYACCGVICDQQIPSGSTIHIVREKTVGNTTHFRIGARTNQIVEGDEVDASHGFVEDSVISDTSASFSTLSDFYFCVFTANGYSNSNSGTFKIYGLWYE